MKYALPIAMLLLTGCANDHYTVVAGGLGSASGMKADLTDCKVYAIHAAADAQPHGGVLVGAVLGGAVGAVIGSAFDQPGQHIDIDQLVSTCMASRGYNGTSEN